MSSHSYDNAFVVEPHLIEKFHQDGFVKLPGFLNHDVINSLRDRVEFEMSHAPNSFKREFSRLKYDFESDKSDVYELLERPYLRAALTEIVQRDLFLTFELTFEIQKNINTGFPWHVGVQSFGYQVAEEFGCTIWAPLDPIIVDGQRGGMAYVPERIVSGRFIYGQIEPAIISTLEARDQAGIASDLNDYFALRSGILNSPAMDEILKWHSVEDHFEPGDVLLFNKYVIHRSIMLHDGPLNKRAAFVMRFVDLNSHYDLQRAKNLEYPVEKFGHEAPTRSHIEIGAPDGAVLSECSYFSDRHRRVLRRQSSPQDASEVAHGNP